MINAGADTFTFDQGKPNISGQPTKAWQAMIDVLIAAKWPGINDGLQVQSGPWYIRTST